MTIIWKPLNERHAEDLDLLRKMVAAGVGVATAAAMHYCAKYQLEPPPWLVRESAKVQCSNLRGDLPQGLGRSSGVTNRFRQDAIHYWRWSVIMEIREKREYLKREIATLQSNKGREANKLLNDGKKMLEWLGTNNDRAFECASLILAETSARGGSNAMKKSFLKVERDMRDPGMALRYHILDDDFLKAAGLYANRSAPSGKKVMPYWDLTD